jgi:hypothetical protein
MESGAGDAHSSPFECCPVHDRAPFLPASEADARPLCRTVRGVDRGAGDGVWRSAPGRAAGGRHAPARTAQQRHRRCRTRRSRRSPRPTMSSKRWRFSTTHACFSPASVSRPSAGANVGLLSAKSRREQMQRRAVLSMTSSARASSAGGTSEPSAVAVLRLNTSSYSVGACTGRSAGFSPFMMRFCVAANHDAARRTCPRTTIGRMSDNVAGPDGTEARIS